MSSCSRQPVLRTSLMRSCTSDESWSRRSLTLEVLVWGLRLLRSWVEVSMRSVGEIRGVWRGRDVVVVWFCRILYGFV